MKPFSLKYRTFGLWQTNWVDKFWGIWGIFGQTISTHCGTVSPLSMFPLINHYFYKKTKPLYFIPNVYLELGFEFGPQRIRYLASLCLQSVVLSVVKGNVCYVSWIVEFQVQQSKINFTIQDSKKTELQKFPFILQLFEQKSG